MNEFGKNHSKVNQQEENNSNLSILVRIFLSVPMIFIIAITLFGNTLVVVAVVKFRKLKSQMCFRFLSSLAISDVCVAIFVMSVSVLYFLLPSWPFGFVFCRFWISCDVMCCTASILHLCAVAGDRYIYLAHGLRYMSLMTSKRVSLIIVSIWLLSALISFVPIFAEWFAPFDQNITTETKCEFEVNNTYALISSMTSFYIPFFALVVIYFQIYRIATSQAKHIRHERSSCEMKNIRNDRKAMKTVGLVVGLFSLCWFPFFIMYLVKPFCKRCIISEEWVLFITWIGYVNSSFNPILYCFTQQEFRISFIKLICICKCKCAQNISNERTHGFERPFSTSIDTSV